MTTKPGSDWSEAKEPYKRAVCKQERCKRELSGKYQNHLQVVMILHLALALTLVKIDKAP